MTGEPPPGIDAIRGALQSGNVDEVLRLIERDLSGALSTGQRHALLLMRARLLSVLGEPDSARPDFDSALDYAVTDFERGVTLLARGELCESAGWIEQARADLTAALPLLVGRSDSATARQTLGRVERDHGDLGSGIDLLRAARDDLLASEPDADRLAEVTLDLAMALRLAGDTDESIALLEGLIEDVEPPFAARILIQIGTTRGFAGQPELALDAYARALPLLPDSADRAVVRYNRAVVLRDQGALVDARDEVERALIENAGESARVEFDALLLAGVVAREQDDFQRALDFLREAAELQPEGDPHGRARLEIATTMAATGLFGPAIDEFGIAIALCVDDADRARAHRFRAMARHELGMLDASLDDVDAAIALTADPDDRAHGLSTRATLLATLDRREEALESLDNALASALDGALHSRLLVQRGSLRSRFGRLDEAVSDFTLVARRAESVADWDMLSRVMVDLGAIHVARQEDGEAISCFTLATTVALDQSVSYLALLNLGNLRVSRREPDEALNAFERAASAAADDRDARAAAFLARGNAFLRWGRYGEAHIEFKRILTLQPSDAILEQSGIARRATRLHLQDIQTMRDTYTRIVEATDQASYRASPMLQRGMLALAAGDAEAALLDVTRATRLFRLRHEQAQAFAHLALVHASLGRCDEAIAALATAREYDPGDRWLQLLAGKPGWFWCHQHSDLPAALLTGADLVPESEFRNDLDEESDCEDE
ncbi:MAG TPA: tetratricopeptide repeat protein [Thermomicrobiales bacterium]|nr:tetratricopeptide repeat protein [Thermomicrobiales bacterium]